MNSNTKRSAAPWWRGAFLYQIYPRSFLDTNGDGLGDLPGITQKLDYIAALGVDGVWISPFFKSPMKDFGYDVSDYRDVDPIFGTLKGFDVLLERAHELDLKIIIDLVLSHTSDEHPWFIESRKDKTNPKADWYVWAERKNNDPPNNWISVFGGPAWTFDKTREQYYLHNFLTEQPDLNYHNPEVQQAVLDTARFWLDRGVDGFRLDVVNFYFHDKQLRDNPPRTHGKSFGTQLEIPDPYSDQQHVYDKSQPENLEFLERFRALIDEYPDRFTVGEIGDDYPNERSAEYTRGQTRLNTCYNTDMMSGARKELTASIIREPLEEFLKYPDSWPSWAFTNHDVVRAASRWHPGDGFGHDPRLSKMLIALLGTLYGTVFMYQGEELGLPEAKLKREELRDPWGIRLYPKWQGRDGCRTPMPWDEKPLKSWLPVPASHNDLNVATQEKDKDSILNFTREFLKWRKTKPELRDGDIKFIETGDKKLLAFSRGTLNCVFNLGPDEKIWQGETLGPYGFSFSG